MIHAKASSSTALGDTVKTSIGDITMPPDAIEILGFWGYGLGGAGNTTLENLSGIFSLESESLKLQPLQYPLDILTITGTGVGILSVRVWPHKIPNVGNAKITGYMTLDLAQTIGNTGRWGVIYRTS